MFQCVLAACQRACCSRAGCRPRINRCWPPGRREKTTGQIITADWLSISSVWPAAAQLGHRRRVSGSPRDQPALAPLYGDLLAATDNLAARFGQPALEICNRDLLEVSAGLESGAYSRTRGLGDLKNTRLTATRRQPAGAWAPLDKSCARARHRHGPVSGRGMKSHCFHGLGANADTRSPQRRHGHSRSASLVAATRAPWRRTELGA
jgi:hypothetical protein